MPFEVGSIVGRAELDISKWIKAQRELKNRFNELNSNFRGFVSRARRGMDSFNKIGSSLNKGAGEFKKFTAEVSKANEKIKKTTRSMRAMGQSAQSIPKKSAKALKLFGTAIKGIAIGLITVGLKNAYQEARKFTNEIKNVSTITNMSIKDIRAGIKSLHPTLGTASELTRGMYQAISAGVDSSKAIDFVATSAKFAKAALTDTDTAVNAITTALNAYSLEANNAGYISDIFFETIKQGKLTGEDLAQAIGSSIPIFAGAGIQIEELSAGMAALTRINGDASMSSTQLNAVVNAFLKPSEEMSKALKAQGIASGGALLQTEGLAGALNFLQSATGGNIDELSKLLPNIRAMSGAQTLLNNNSKAYTDILEGMQRAIGATEEAFKKQLDPTDKLRSNLQLLKENIGALVEKFLSAALPMLIEFTQFLKKITVKDVIAGIVGITVALVGFKAAITASRVGWQGLLISMGIGALVTLIGFLVAKMVKFVMESEEAQKKLKKIWGHVKDFIIAAWVVIKDVFGKILSKVKDIIASVASKFKFFTSNLALNFEGAKLKVAMTFEKIKNIILNIINSLMQKLMKNKFFAMFLGGASDALSKAVDKSNEKLKEYGEQLSDLKDRQKELNEEQENFEKNLRKKLDGKKKPKSGSTETTTTTTETPTTETPTPTTTTTTTTTTTAITKKTEEDIEKMKEALKDVNDMFSATGEIVSRITDMITSGYENELKLMENKHKREMELLQKSDDRKKLLLDAEYRRNRDMMKMQHKENLMDIEERFNVERELMQEQIQSGAIALEEGRLQQSEIETEEREKKQEENWRYLQDRLDAEKKYQQKKAKAEETAEQKKARLEEKQRKEKDEIERKIFEAKKVNDITRASVDFAQSVIAIWGKALATTGEPTTAAILASVLQGVLAGVKGAQIGVIASQQYVPSYATGGTHHGGLARTDELGGELKVLPDNTIIIPHDISRNIADAINKNKGIENNNQVTNYITIEGSSNPQELADLIGEELGRRYAGAR